MRSRRSRCGSPGSSSFPSRDGSVGPACRAFVARRHLRALAQLAAAVGLIAALLAAPAAFAELVVTHLGASDPTTEGWMAVGAGVSVTTGPEIGDQGVDAWSVDDDGASAGSQLQYVHAPTPGQVADGAARGWRLTTRLRVAEFPDLPDTGESIVLSYRDGAREYTLRFFADAAGLPVVVLADDVALPPRINLTTDGYHAYQVEFDPVSGLASVYVDGTLERTGWDGVPDAGTAQILWGSRDDADMGRGHSAAVAFETLEPAPACSDGVDNDGDLLIDHPDDPGCPDPEAEREDPACDNGLDDDLDGLADWDGAGLGAPDPECVDRSTRITERPVRSLFCASPFSRISLAGPPFGSAEVTSTCFFDSILDQSVPTQGRAHARSRGIPRDGLFEGRQEHDVIGGILEPTDNLQTEWSPGFLFSIPRGVEPDEDVRVVSDLFQLGSHETLLAEARITGNGVDLTCGISPGPDECQVLLPGGATYALEPVLETAVFAGEGRATLQIGVSHVTRCADGIDNDGDLLIDLADPQCVTPDDLDEVENFCTDGIDNDADGLIDASDPGCTGPSDVDELNPAIECDDGVDNDADLLIDAADPGCGSPLQNDESPECNDGIDNDGDLLIDHPADTGCGTPSQGSENPECQDGIDNDSNGATDFPDDPGCTSPLDLVENAPPFECGDTLDNDGDGATDFPLDTGCVSQLDASERVTSELQRRCVKTMNDRGSAVAKAHHRASRLCLSDAQRGRTSKLGSPATAQDCLTNDVRNGIARRVSKLIAGDNDRCLADPAQLPLFAYTGAASVESAATDAAVDLVGDLFGPDLDTALVLQASDRDSARCQREVLSRSTKLFDQLWRSTRRVKDAALARSAATEPASAAALETEIVAALLLDADGRILRREGQLLGGALRRCGGLALPLSQVFPGSCAGAAGQLDLAECATEQTRCRFCLSLNAYDGLAADCDAFDNATADGSCF